MPIFLLMLIAAETAATPASPVDSLFGNTLTVTGPEGSTTLWYKPDGTFTAKTDKGEQIGGRWEYEDGKICSFIATPAPKPKHCGNLGVHHVGDQWEDTRPNGAKVQLKLTAGS